MLSGPVRVLYPSKVVAKTKVPGPAAARRAPVRRTMASTELEAQAASLKLALGADAPDGHDLVPFVKASDGDVAQAAARWKESQAARKEYRQLTVKDVAEFYRAPAGGGAFPCGCIFPQGLAFLLLRKMFFSFLHFPAVFVF